MIYACSPVTYVLDPEQQVKLEEKVQDVDSCSCDLRKTFRCSTGGILRPLSLLFSLLFDMYRVAFEGDSQHAQCRQLGSMLEVDGGNFKKRRQF